MVLSLKTWHEQVEEEVWERSIKSNQNYKKED